VSGTAPTVFLQCGLRIRSEVELHLPVSLGDGFDADVRWGADIHDSSEPPPGEVIAAYGSGEDSWYTATATGSEFLVRFRDCGEFVISRDLSEVQIRRDPAGRFELLPILMAGTVTAFMLTLRGETVLHASAVAIDGAALAFVGQSGRGKSTLAALLCLEGAELITDDVLTVDTGPPVTCIGGASELRLRTAAAELATTRPGSVIRATADDRLAFSPTAARIEPLPLGAIVVPGPSRTASDVEIRRLPPSTAVFWLLAFPRVHGWCRPDVLSRDFTTLSEIVNQIPVYDVTIPWGPPFDPGVAGSLSALAVSHETANPTPRTRPGADS
jgi:hypothetical protein